MRVAWSRIHSVRIALLPVVVVVALFARPMQAQSDEDAAAEIKRRVIETLQLRGGETVADVGCGDGFYTLPLARALGTGKVVAEDIDHAALAKLKKRLADQQIKNVEVVKGKADDPFLTPDSLDAVLIVNAYHEMSAHETMLRHVRAALKPGATVVLMEGIWDNREKQSRDEQTKRHQLAPPTAKEELEAAGFEIVSVRDPFVERPPDEDGKSRWWLITARRPAAR
jgi:cyclopropane fatty-acyl-phospholipid synthase-like methyltransferase